MADYYDEPKHRRDPDEWWDAVGKDKWRWLQEMEACESSKQHTTDGYQPKSMPDNK